MAEMDSFMCSDDGEESALPWTGVLRASGKRFRRRFNPNDWESSILTMRHNVLCLGMSYPCVENVIANYRGKDVKIFHSAPSVERSVELVRRNLLNQIDGRDLARVVALEANNDILAYTVSKEQGAHYDQRHLNADFNSRTLVNQMHMRWGKTVRFRQVILDYFWSPSGSWAMKHWQKFFFNENIPRLVTEGMFNFGDLENDSVFVSALEANTAEDFISSTAAVVYLPFSSHCLSQVVAWHDNLSQFYTISFLRKDQLDEHTLWKATQSISPESMSGWLAKVINQEEIYCTLGARQIKHMADDASVLKEDILDVFNRIDRSDDVRMIKLTALRKFHPDFSKSDMHRAKPTLGLNKGGYVGLRSNRPIVHKKVEIVASVITMVKLIPGNQVQQTKQQGMPRKISLSHQQLDKFWAQKMSRKRSLSCQNLDKLGSRKRKKRVDVLMHHDPQIDVKIIISSEGSLPNDLPKESTTLTGIALEWDRILTSFELDYTKRINSGKATVDFVEKCCRAIDEIEYVNQINSDERLGPAGVPLNVQGKDNKTTESIKGPAASEAAQTMVPESNKTPPISESINPAENDRMHTPVAMLKIAQLRRVKPEAFVGTPAAKDGSEAPEQQSDGATPNVNDVLMVADHRSHAGNTQFFDALLMCAHDFSRVADCFVDALTSLEPPGRFLGKEKEDDTWACMDYGLAINLVPHLLENYELNCHCNSILYNERSCTFLSVVQQFYDVKFKVNKNPGQFSQLRDASPTECKATGPQYQSSPGDVNVDKDKSSVGSTSSFKFKSVAKQECDTNVLCSSCQELELPAMTSEEVVPSTVEEWKSFATKKPISIKSGKKKDGLAKRRRGNSLALLALAEERSEGDGDRNSASSEGATKPNATKKSGRKGKSLALALALSEHEEEKRGTSEERTNTPNNDELENQLEPSSPSPAMDTKTTMIASPTNTSNANQTRAGRNGKTAEEIAFECLGKWLQPTATAGGAARSVGAASMEIALRQISERGNISAYKLLTHAFEEEAASLRSLCTGK